MGARATGFSLEGMLEMTLQCDHPDRVRVRAERAFFDRKRDQWVIRHRNGMVNTGLNIALDRMFGLSGPPAVVGFIGVDNNTTAVTSATAFLHGAGAGSAATTIIKALSPAATRTAQTVTGGATFANADFTSGVFVINKVGLLNTSTDAGTGLIDVIGGTGGTDPYSRTFVVDFTNAGTFTLIPQIALTGVASKGAFPSPL